MRAVLIPAYGGPEVACVGELPLPEPGEGEIRVRVAGASLNNSDVQLRRGEIAMNMTGGKPFVPSMESAGVVDAVGSGATWQVGDRVVAHSSWNKHGRGGMAEYVVVHSDQAAHAPHNVTLVEAATLAMNGLTAQLALDTLNLAAGQTLLVTGAAGAVGGYAAQLAVADGIRVIALAAPRDEDLIRGFGAEFLARGDDAAERVRQLVPDGVDALFDPAKIAKPIFAAVRDGGHIVEIRDSGVEPGRDIEADEIRVTDYIRAREKLERLSGLVEQGKLRLRVAGTFRPEDIVDAYRKLEAGGLRGRLVCTF